MRLIVDLDDDDGEMFVKHTRDVHGNVRLCCKGQTKAAHIVAVAVPVTVAGTKHRLTAVYDVTPLAEL